MYIHVPQWTFTVDTRDNGNEGKVFSRFRECCLYNNVAEFYITILILQNYNTKYCGALQFYVHYLDKMNILMFITYSY